MKEYELIWEMIKENTPEELWEYLKVVIEEHIIDENEKTTVIDDDGTIVVMFILSRILEKQGFKYHHKDLNSLYFIIDEPSVIKDLLSPAKRTPINFISLSFLQFLRYIAVMENSSFGFEVICTHKTKRYGRMVNHNSRKAFSYADILKGNVDLTVLTNFLKKCKEKIQGGV